MKYPIDFVDAMTTLDYSVKNTFMHFTETEKIGGVQPSTTIHRSYSDIAQNRDRPSLEYLQRFLVDEAQAAGESSLGHHTPRTIARKDFYTPCNMLALAEDAAFPPSEFFQRAGCEQRALAHQTLPQRFEGARRGLDNVDVQERLTTGSSVAPGVSMGSAYHSVGDCKPCAWFWKPTSCNKGHMCEYCHSCEQWAFERRNKEKKLAARMIRSKPK